MGGVNSLGKGNSLHEKFHLPEYPCYSVF